MRWTSSTTATSSPTAWRTTTASTTARAARPASRRSPTCTATSPSSTTATSRPRPWPSTAYVLRPGRACGRHRQLRQVRRHHRQLRHDHRHRDFRNRHRECLWRITEGKYYGHFSNSGDIVAYASVGTLAGDYAAGRSFATGTALYGSEIGLTENTGSITAYAITHVEDSENAATAISFAFGAKNAATQSSTIVNAGDIAVSARADFGFASAYGTFVQGGYAGLTTNTGAITAIARSDNGMPSRSARTPMRRSSNTRAATRPAATTRPSPAMRAWRTLAISAPVHRRSVAGLCLRHRRDRPGDRVDLEYRAHFRVGGRRRRTRDRQPHACGRRLGDARQ